LLICTGASSKKYSQEIPLLTETDYYWKVFTETK
jgi:hypothetical protein